MLGQEMKQPRNQATPPPPCALPQLGFGLRLLDLTPRPNASVQRFSQRHLVNVHYAVGLEALGVSENRCPLPTPLQTLGPADRRLVESQRNVTHVVRVVSSGSKYKWASEFRTVGHCHSENCRVSNRTSTRVVRVKVISPRFLHVDP